jgi:hypothetical protein
MMVYERFEEAEDKSVSNSVAQAVRLIDRMPLVLVSGDAASEAPTCEYAARKSFASLDARS